MKTEPDKKENKGADFFYLRLKYYFINLE